MIERETEGMLAPYKVLDLCDEDGMLCGRILADLGAEVIAVEPPQGNSARKLGPFYQNTPGLERSFFWFTLSAGKKSITLNLETADGKDAFKQLVRTADVVLESFPPGCMDGFGLSYKDLRKINPRLVMTSITPFGSDGPYKDFKASDIVTMGLSGLAYISGEPDQAPLRIPMPQSYFHGAAWAAAGTMIALYNREVTGQGQHVDTSMQQAACLMLYPQVEWWSYAKTVLKRTGTWRQAGLGQMKLIYPCKDGHVLLFFLGGTAAGPGQGLLIEWMDREGMCPDWLRGFDSSKLDLATSSQDFFDRLSEAFTSFFMTKTKAELFEWADKNILFLAPVNSIKDLLQNPQLEARKFWVQLEHADLNTRITYPGAFLQAAETPIILETRAPHIGEHNEGIYSREFGWSKEKLVELKQAEVI